MHYVKHRKINKDGDAKTKKIALIITSISILIAVSWILFCLELGKGIVEAVSKETQQGITTLELDLANSQNTIRNLQRNFAPPAQSSEIYNTPEPLETVIKFTERDINLVTQTVWGEARGTTVDEWRLVVWTILQRVDSDCGRWSDDIEGVVTQNRQFHGFNPNFPISYYARGVNIRDIVIEELEKWTLGEEPPLLYPFATSLPYFFFTGDYRPGEGIHHNWFRERWR